MKKILIYIHSYFPFEDSNTNVLLPIIEELKKDYKVDILSCNKNNREPLVEKDGNHNVFRFKNYKGLLRKIERLSNINLINADNKSIKSFMYKMTGLIFSGLSKLLTKSDLSVLKYLIETYKYDVLITVTSPIKPQYTALKLSQGGHFNKHKVIWLPYFTDPYAAYIGNAANKTKLFELEKEIYKFSEAIIVTPEIFRDNQQNPLVEYTKKSFSIPLANLKENLSSGRFSGFISGKINCLYTGSLQDTTVRNPEYLFKIIEKLSEEDIIFHMIINRWSKNTLLMKDKYLKKSKNVIWYDEISLEESLIATKNADILLNIGNLSSNQLPGKVSDYIASGRPIVNFYTCETDTSKIFLEEYPLKLNIKETDNSNVRVEEFINFCKTNYTKSVPYSNVEELYSNFKSENVSRKFKELVANIMRT